MPYLIDGHNLIPRVPGLRLDQAEDEMALIELLGEFCRRNGKRVEVYFDKAAPGGMRARVFGSVTAHFVREERTADAAIAARLKRLGRTAANWTVVSSDNEVLGTARAARARTLPSQDFARLLASEAQDEAAPSSEAPLSEAEVEDWLSLFEGEEEA